MNILNTKNLNKKILKLFIAVILGVSLNYYYNFFINHKINHIIVEGCRIFPADNIKKAVQKYIKESNGYKNLHKIQQIVMDFDYVSDCYIRSYNKNGIIIYITEREPIAKNIDNDLICSDNKIIKSVFADHSRFFFKDKLLKIYNAIDIKNTIEATEIKKLRRLLALYAIEPDLCICIREGRWDLWYKNKLIKLPIDIEAGLKAIVQNDEKTWFVEAKMIDLRRKGYAIVENNIRGYEAEDNKNNEDDKKEIENMDKKTQIKNEEKMDQAKMDQDMEEWLQKI